MRALRTIFRLDFLRNYEMINQPGTVARLINEAAPAEYFDFFGEDRAARRILVKRQIKEALRFRSLTVEPTAIVCDLEVGDGLPIQAFADDNDFVTMTSIISSLLKKFEITRIERAGLRLFMFGANAGGTKNAVRAFRSLVSTTVLGPVEAQLGKIIDLGISADGVADTKVAYRLRSGPFIGAEEYIKYFSNINDLLPKETADDTVIDLDLYENKFSYTAAGVIKWCVPQFAAASGLADRIAEIVAKEAAK
jgi:hypothetical protein